MASDNILVAVKSRPFLVREKSSKLKPQWLIQDKENIIFQVDDEGHRIGEPYSFDYIFSETSTNDEVYNIVVEPLVKSSLQGFNSTIFAYGQTSSGKTHTMMGNKKTPGIIQHAVQDIFKYIQDNTQRDFLIRCSYFEIYKEKINDLFDKNGEDLKIREDLLGTVSVGSKTEVVTEAGQVYDLMRVGNKTKKIGCTNMNEKSSRSHTIFRFIIESREKSVPDGPVQISQLNLVDLAGSERVAHTKAEGIRFDEGININKSLSALGNVIRQLSDGEGFINYRDSKLTRILQQALGGNAKSLIIATITLAVGDETKSTLEFAQRAKVIKNKPIVNEILSEQEKSKQYEMMLANCKGRLEIEMKRIKEMEREKEDREKEISKLRDHLRLIDSFAHGTRDIKRPSKIPRRHTVGHYGSQPTILEPIPEAYTLPSTSGYTERGRQSELSFEEGLKDLEDTGGTSSEPKLTEGVSTQTSPSPETVKVRYRHLEESYVSLKEFTKLEAECRDTSLVEELKKEKDALLKDLTHYNLLLIEERKDAQTMKETYENEKLKYEREIQLLKQQLELQVHRNKESQYNLDQLKSEMVLIKEIQNQETESYKFHLEQQAADYENQIKFLKTEVDRLNSELTSDERHSREALQNEIEILKSENRSLQISKDEIQLKSQETITDLQDKLVNLQMVLTEEETELLSKLYSLKDILENNHDVQNNLDEKRARNKLEGELTDIKDRNIYVETENKELQTMINELKQKVADLDYENSELLKRSEDSETHSMNLVEKLSEKSVECDKLTIEVEKSESRYNYIDLKLQRHTREYEEIIQDLKNKKAEASEKLQHIEKENTANQREILRLQKELEERNEHIVKLKEKMIALSCENDEIKMKIDYIVEEKKELEKQNKKLDININLLNYKIEKLKGYNAQLAINLSEHREKVGDTELQQLIDRLKQDYKKLENLKFRRSTELLAVSVDEASQMMVDDDDLETIQNHEQQVIEKVIALTTENNQLKTNLDVLQRDVSYENSLMVARIRELEATIKKFKGRIESVHKLVSSPYKLTADLSPREVRRRKRQSIHDQRRRLDVGDGTDSEEASTSGLQEDDIEGTLTRLETEVRYLISTRQEEELKDLRLEVEELRAKVDHCASCKLKDIQINHLTDLQEKDVYKFVELETKIADLENKHKIEKEALTEKIHHMRNRILNLESDIEEKLSIQKQTVEMQTDCCANWQDNFIYDLRQQINFHTAQNTALEAEIQGFIRELDDCRKYLKEQELEIKVYKQEIETLKGKIVQCRICDLKQKRIKELEDLNKQLNFKCVDLQTTIYDLMNRRTVETANFEDRIQFMQTRVTELQKIVDEINKKEMVSVGIECDMFDYEHLQAKYNYMKRLAQVRREEGNKLRARLDMLPDQPVD